MINDPIWIILFYPNRIYSPFIGNKFRHISVENSKVFDKNKYPFYKPPFCKRNFPRIRRIISLFWLMVQSGI